MFVLLPVNMTLPLFTVTCATFVPPSVPLNVTVHSWVDEVAIDLVTVTFPDPTVDRASNAVCTVAALAFQVIFDVVWPLNDRVNVPAKSDVAVKPTRCVSLIGPPSVVVVIVMVGVGVAPEYQSSAVIRFNWS